VGKNVAVFVDVANIFYAAKAAGVDIDYVTLLKSATAGRDFVRAYAYTGLDPDNENQRNFHAFLARNHYKVVSKDIRKYGDGKVKANLDIELVVDLMKTARNLDVAIVVSGDGDFAPAIRAVQEMGVRVEVISFRGNTSSDLIEVADLFTDITQLARVEKGSSRSGRRVASDGEEDLSMTEVPDKQTEGTGTPRGRGRGRGRGRAAEAEPAASSRNGSRAAASASSAAANAASAAGLTILPGEKLSRAAAPGSAPAEAGAAAAGDVEATPFDAAEELEEGDGRRRRRRRGGRGRGRGRGREQETAFEPEAGPVAATPGDDEEEEDEIDVPSTRRGPAPTPFGSVWDSQLGVASSRPTPIAPYGGDDVDDLDEPEIPEYLIAEQRRGQGGQGGRGGRGPGGQGGRGGRSARGSYGAAIDRERYGRGGGGGINRYPDVGNRGASRGGRQQPAYGRGDRQPRPDRPERQQQAGRSSTEPWSEVPEELEAMLRAQLAGSPKGAPRAGSAPRPADAVAAALVTGDVADAVETAAPAPKRRGRRPATETAAPADAAAIAETAGAADVIEAPKRRTTRRKAVTADPAGTAESTEAAGTDDTPAGPKKRATRATSTRTTRSSSRTKAAATSDEPGPTDADGAAAPKKRATRKKAETA
jgi:uncharacterized LabA/DUF88 family protein